MYYTLFKLMNERKSLDYIYDFFPIFSIIFGEYLT